MTTTRTARRGRAIPFLTMGVLAAVPLLPTAAQATPEPMSVTFPQHPGHMIPVRHPGAASPVSTASTPNHFASDAGAARGTDGKLEYFGGRVISNVKVYDILWGPTTSFDPTYLASIGGFYSAILTSSYWTWLAEYDTAGLLGSDNQPGSNQTIGAGSFAGVIPITPSVPGVSVTAQQVGAEIAHQISIGIIPPLDLDAAGNVNSIYMVDFPGTITITDFGSLSCKDFCAEHQTMQITQGSTTYSVPYAIMPSQYTGACTIGAGCGLQTKFANSTSIASHELAESVTDTEIGLAQGLDAPIAWYDATDQHLQQGMGGGEIGDLCDGIAGSSGPYTVQKLWSNFNNACIDAAPFCNGTSQPPYCTPCAATDDGVGCFGATPVCETSATSGEVGQCVACTATSPCATGPTAFCDVTTDTCVGCTASDCIGGAGVCETAGAQQGRCVQCDPAHASACTGTTALCDPATFSCVGCVTNATCSGGTPICDFDAQECRACLSAADCGNQACDTDTTSANAGQCVPCTTSAQCTGSATGNVCTAGVCGMGTPDAGAPPSMDAGNGKKDSGKDAGHTESDATSGADGGAKASSGSSGGCTVGGGSKGDALGWLAMLGLVVVGRRRRSA
jgi:hypothetical protein